MNEDEFKPKLIEISACRPNRNEQGCPAEYDGHCMLGFNIDTVSKGISKNCPLKKSPVLLQLKAEVLMEAVKWK